MPISGKNVISDVLISEILTLKMTL